jgi:hypothetical protein
MPRKPEEFELDDEWLAGNVGGAAKVGDTVHRPVGIWTPAVHALLSYLAPRLPHIPRVLGFDEQGREMLDFLPGRVIDTESESLSEAQIVSLVSWTRDFHAAVANFDHPGPWRYFPMEGPTLIGHNDIAPYNSCFDGDDLAGVFDWDLAGPTTPLNDLAFLAWNCVPLWSDIGAELAARRLALIATTYGGFDGAEVLKAVPARIQIMLDGIPASAAAGDAGMANLVAQGEPERSRGPLTGFVARIPEIFRQLS